MTGLVWVAGAAPGTVQPDSGAAESVLLSCRGRAGVRAESGVADTALSARSQCAPDADG